MPPINNTPRKPIIKHLTYSYNKPNLTRWYGPRAFLQCDLLVVAVLRSRWVDAEGTARLTVGAAVRTDLGDVVAERAENFSTVRAVESDGFHLREHPCASRDHCTITITHHYIIHLT
jgi:hypothetical protein